MAVSRCFVCYAEMAEGRCSACGWRDPAAEAPREPDEVVDPNVAPLPVGSAPPLPGSEPQGPRDDEGLPPFPSGGLGGGAGGPAEGPPPLVVHPRVVVWLLLAAVIAVYFSSGGGFQNDLTLGQLRASGGLSTDLVEHLASDWWRLVLGTYVHHSLWVLIISCFMIWTQGGLAERLGGGGLPLFLFVAGSLPLNFMRSGLESTSSLGLLAGSWPVGLACGGAAVALGVRAGVKPGRLLFSLVFEAGLLAWIAFASDVLGGGLALVAGSALGLGFFVGSVWPMQKGPFGCFAGAIAGVILGSAFLGQHERPRGVTAPPRDWREQNPAEWKAWQEQHPGVEEEPVDLQPRKLEELKVEVSLPRSWGRYPLPRKRDCPSCEAEITLPEPPPEDRDAKVDCPTCGAQVSAHKKLHQVLFRSGSSMFGRPKELLVWAVPRGPYDAPDTLATRLIADLGGPDSWFKGAIAVEERSFASEQMPEGYLAVLRGFIGGRAMRMRLYLFVDDKRTVLLRTVTADPGEGPEAEAQARFFDAVAATVQRTK